MNVLVYGVTNWDNKSQAERQTKSLTEWYNRTTKYVDYSDIFLTSGSYSDPEYNPLDVPLIQNGLQHTRDYGRGWNYFRNGFITGIWYALFKQDWDVLLHNQCRMFLGEDMNDKLERFHDRPELIMAPKFSNIACVAVEVGCVAMKREAAVKIISESRRPSLSYDDYSVMNCEDELLDIFEDSWYDPFNIRTTRKKDWNWPEPSPFHLGTKEFLDLPIISASHHCTDAEIDEWMAKHPINNSNG